MGIQVGFKGERRPPEGCLNKKGASTAHTLNTKATREVSVGTARPKRGLMVLYIFSLLTAEDRRRGTPVDRKSFHNNMMGAARKSFLFPKHKKIT